MNFKELKKAIETHWCKFKNRSDLSIVGKLMGCIYTYRYSKAKNGFQNLVGPLRANLKYNLGFNTLYVTQTEIERIVALRFNMLVCTALMTDNAAIFLYKRFTYEDVVSLLYAERLITKLEANSACLSQGNKEYDLNKVMRGAFEYKDYFYQYAGKYGYLMQNPKFKKTYKNVSKFNLI